MYLSRKPSHKSHVAIWFLDLPSYRSLSVFRKKVAAANFHEWHCADALSPGTTLNSKRNGMRIIQRILNIGNYLIEIGKAACFAFWLKIMKLPILLHRQFIWNSVDWCQWVSAFNAYLPNCLRQLPIDVAFILFAAHAALTHSKIYISLYVYILIHVSNPYLSISLSLNSLNSTI